MRWCLGLGCNLGLGLEMWFLGLDLERWCLGLSFAVRGYCLVDITGITCV